MKLSTIASKYPTYRDDAYKNSYKWLRGKRLDDNAENLWRVHDKLYDLSAFAERHPGGRDWIELTQGTDITEAFETHHITEAAMYLIKKFYVRDASLPRNYKLTYHEDGFYRTLKRKVAQKLETNTSESHPRSMSKFYCDIMLAMTVFSFVYAARDFNAVSAALAIISLFLLTIISHNFLHQRDNWRMYLVNLNLQNYRDWRVFHVLSHHLYPNSYHDLECSLFEPFLNWMPLKRKSALFSFIYTPFVYFSLFIVTLIHRISEAALLNIRLRWDETLPIGMLLLMNLTGNYSFGKTFLIWYTIITATSFSYAFFAINGSHHHSKMFHDGDELKSLDFGIYQLAATCDRAELQKNDFLTLSTFGHHIAHHLFPTLDHLLLPEFNDIIHETCREFETELKIFPWYKLVIGQFEQLARKNSIKVS